MTVAVSCTGAGGTGRLMQAAGGSASATLTAPMAPGTYTITATGHTSGFTASMTITVVARPHDGGDRRWRRRSADNRLGQLVDVWIAGTAVIVGAGLPGSA